MTAPTLAQPVEKQTPPKWSWGQRHGQQKQVFLGEETNYAFHSAFPYASWYLHNCCDSQFCLHSLKEAKVRTLGKVTHQLAFSSYLLTAVLHMLYTQGSVKHVLKPWPLQICGTSLPHSPSPFVMHVSYPPAMTNNLLFYPSPDLIPLAAVTGCYAKAISFSVVTHWSSGTTWNPHSPGKLKILACCVLLLNRQNTWANIIIYFETFRSHQSKPH